MQMQHGVAVRRDEFVECPTCAAKPGSPMLCGSCLHNRTAVSDLRETLRRIIGLTTPFTQPTEADVRQALFEIHKVAAEAYGLKRGI